MLKHIITLIAIVLFLSVGLFCQDKQGLFETETTTATVVEEEFTEEQEKLLEEAYEQLENIEQETTGAVADEETQLLQEDEGFLESLRQTPLDINTASYIQLKSLPGITAELARKIVRYRRTKPFKSKSELKQIVGDELYKKISPYVRVYKTKQPAKLKGQVRLRIRQDELQEVKTKYVPKEKFEQPFYLYNRTQLSYGDKVSLGYVFLHRPMEIEINQDTFQYFLRKWWVRINSLWMFDKVIFGNYKAGFGYGMVFHENSAVEGFLGTIKPKMHGLREDKSTSDNAYLYGIGVESSFGSAEISLFGSYKQLIVPIYVSTITYVDENTGQEIIQPIYEPKADLMDIRNSYIEYNYTLMDYDINIPTSTYGKLPTSKVQEKLLGFNFTIPVSTLKLGLCGYYSEYSIPFDIDKTKTSGYDLDNKYSEKWGYVYRGDRLSVGSLYFEFPFDKLTIFGEVAKSKCWFSVVSTTTLISQQEGHGTNLGILLPISKAKFYILYTYLEPHFYSPLGTPIKVYDYYNNQEGIKLGSELLLDKFRINFYYATSLLFKGIWSGYSGSESPRYPSKYNELFFETKYRPIKSIELYFRTFDDLRERYINLKTYEITSNDEYVQTQQLRIRNRYQITYEVSKQVNIRARYEQRWHSFIDYNKTYYGEQLWAELKYKFWNFTINSRFCIFDAGKDVYLSYLEPQWYNVYISETESSSAGDKYYITLAYKIKKNLVLWLRYRYKVFTTKSGLPIYYLTDTKPEDHDYRLQIDFNF